MFQSLFHQIGNGISLSQVLQDRTAEVIADGPPAGPFIRKGGQSGTVLVPVNPVLGEIVDSRGQMSLQLLQQSGLLS